MGRDGRCGIHRDWPGTCTTEQIRDRPNRRRRTTDGLRIARHIGAQQPNNLTVVVLDNGHYGETGMQKSHTSLGTNLTAVASGCGITWTMDIAEMSKLASLAERINAKQACGLARISVSADELPRALPNRDAVYLKNRFRAALGLQPM